jgi:predicted trehalose synthase
VTPHLQQLLVLLELLPQVRLNQLLQLRGVCSIHSLLGDLATLATGVQDDARTGTVEYTTKTVACQGKGWSIGVATPM